MAYLLDENFQSYADGTTPPYANLSGGGGVVVQDTQAGPYGDSKSLQMGATSGVTYPILPNITLEEAEEGVTYASLGVPSYSTATVWQALFVNYYPAMNGDILIFNSNLNPFSGISIAAVRILPDGTVAITAPRSSAFSNNQAISTYALYPGKWYFFQTTISFSTDGTSVIVNMTVAVNGVPIVASNWTTVQSLSGVPALYWNNITFGGCGNGCFIDRLTIDQPVDAMPSFPHPGTPVARVSQGVIELARFSLFAVTCPPATSGTIGTAYSSSVGVSNGVAPFTYAITAGSLPAGLILNGSTGLISGTPTSTTSSPFTITVTDSTMATASVTCSIEIEQPPFPPPFCIAPLTPSVESVTVAYTEPTELEGS